MASESCGGGDGPCQHLDHMMYWMQQDLSEDVIRIMLHARDGRHPSHKDRFGVAYLIALGALDYDEERDMLSVTDQGQCLVDWAVAERKHG